MQIYTVTRTATAFVEIIIAETLLEKRQAAARNADKARGHDSCSYELTRLGGHLGRMFHTAAQISRFDLEDKVNLWAASTLRDQHLTEALHPLHLCLA